MNLAHLLAAPSPRIQSPERRLRAELSSWIVFVRTVAMVLLLILLEGLKAHDLTPMFGATALSVLGYFITRTRFFEVGVVTIILEPLVAIPAIVAMTKPSIFLDSAPIFLTLGPLMASFVLPIRATVSLILVTSLAFVFILFKVPHEFRPLIAVEFGASFFISSLALLSVILRDRADRVVQEERAKSVHSSKLASLGEMASGIAHELNTPLATISVNAELAELASQAHADTAKEIQPHLVEIAIVVERMGKIISGLKEFSSESSNEKANIIDVSLCVDEALSLCQNKLMNSGIHITVTKPNDHEIKLPLRRHQLSRAILNILDNSFDALKKQDERWIKIDIKSNGAMAEISITDSGTGVAPKIRERVFEPFFTTKGYSQTGLGLSMSKGIAQSHSGDLVFDPASESTRFVMKLPLVS